MPVQRHFSFEVSDAPEEVARRLRERTRWRPFPWQGSPFGNPKRRPLGGRVGDDGFSIALDTRDWWTLYQAVARGRLVPSGAGTRVEGVAGLPGWITWFLRFAFVFGVALSAVGALAPWLEGDPGAVVLAPLLFGFAMVTITLAVGWNVRNADEQVPALVDAVRTATGSRSEAEPAAGRRPVRAPAREPER